MSYVFQFFCGPQAMQQLNPAAKKAGALAGPKASSSSPSRPQQRSESKPIRLITRVLLREVLLDLQGLGCTATCLSSSTTFFRPCSRWSIWSLARLMASCVCETLLPRDSFMCNTCRGHSMSLELCPTKLPVAWERRTDHPLVLATGQAPVLTRFQKPGP